MEQPTAEQILRTAQKLAQLPEHDRECIEWYMEGRLNSHKASGDAQRQDNPTDRTA